MTRHLAAVAGVTVTAMTAMSLAVTPALMAAGEFVTVHERVTWMQGRTEKTQSAVAVYRLRNAQIVSVWYFDVMP